MQGFKLPSCKIHNEMTATHICFQNKASLVCQICLSKCQFCSQHLRSVIDIATFVKSIEDTSRDLDKQEETAMNRYSELTDLSGKFKINYIKEDDEMVKDIMNIFKSENKEYKDICRKEKVAKNKLVAALKLIQYFKPYHEPELFEMKVNLASPKGMRVFLKKAQNHSALLNKKVLGEMKKAEGDLISQHKKLSELQGYSFTLKLKQLLKMASRGDEGRPISELKFLQTPSKEDQ